MQPVFVFLKWIGAHYIRAKAMTTLTVHLLYIMKNRIRLSNLRKGNWSIKYSVMF